MKIRLTPSALFLASLASVASPILLAHCGGSSDGGANSPGTEQTPLARIVESLGGAPALQAMHTLAIDASGSNSAYDEGFNPGAAPSLASDFTLAARIQVDDEKMRLSYRRTYHTIVPGAVNEYSEILAGQGGYVRGIESVFGGSPDTVGDYMSSARRTSTRRGLWFSNPHLLLRRITERDVRDQGVEPRNGQPHRRLLVADPDGVRDLTLWLDPNGQLDALTTMENDHLRGDVRVDVSYEQWERSGDLRFPRKVTISVENETVRVEQRSRVEVNSPLGEELFAFPNGQVPAPIEEEENHGLQNAQSYQRFSGLGVNSFVDPPHDTVTGVEVGTRSGVYHLVGASYHSLLIDQGTSSILVEAPLDEERSNALLGWMDKNLTGGSAAHPISNVIMTHHHVDHSSGLRTFVARGATVVVGKESEAFMRTVFASAHTVRPDALSARQGIAPKLTTIEQGGSLALGNVTAYHVVTTHSADMLVVHVAAAGTAGVLFNSDLYNPSEGAIRPAGLEWAKGFDDAIVQRRLDAADLIMLGGHGNMDSSGRHFNVSYAQFKEQLDAAEQGQP